LLHDSLQALTEIALEDFRQVLKHLVQSRRLVAGGCELLFQAFKA